MREKLIIWLGLAVLGLAIFSGVLQYRIGVVKEEKERLGNNQAALFKKAVFFNYPDLQLRSPNHN